MATIDPSSTPKIPVVPAKKPIPKPTPNNPVDDVAQEVFQAPPPAPPNPGWKTVTLSKEHFSEELRKKMDIHASTIDATREKLVKLDEAATKKRLEVAHLEYGQEEAQALEPKAKEATETKMMPPKKEKPFESPKIKEEEEKRTTANTQETTVNSLEENMKNEQVADLEQAQKEKEERDALNQELHEKKLAIEEDQKKIRDIQEKIR